MSTAESPPPHIKLKVKSEDGSAVFFRIKRSTQLMKLMKAYSERQSMDVNSFAFFFDGRRLRANQTPEELGMVDEDEIDAILHQRGGGTGWPLKRGSGSPTNICIMFRQHFLELASQMGFVGSKNSW